MKSVDALRDAWRKRRLEVVDEQDNKLGKPKLRKSLKTCESDRRAGAAPNV
jgi:hypothetical protein